MKPTAATENIIEIKGHEDIRAVLKTVTNSGGGAAWPRDQSMFIQLTLSRL